MLRDILQELRELGPRGTAFRVGWEFRTRSGLAGRQQRLEPDSTELRKERSEGLWAARLPFADPLSVAEAVRDRIPYQSLTQLRKTAEEALRGRILCFGRWVGEFGDPVDWYRNPLTGTRRSPGAHWSQELKERDNQGDVKLVWEAARFPHAYQLARAAAFFPGRTRDFASGVLAHVEGFLATNPEGRSVHWSSGQEIAVRSLAWLFALDALILRDAAGPQAAELVRRSLWRAARHVREYIAYAQVAVYNNHLLAEGLLLFVAGALLCGTEASRRFREQGQRILSEECNRQFYPDGGYIQLSHNYHRVALQYLLFASVFARSTGNQVNPMWLSAMGRSLDFLLAHQNPVDGRLPNYGSNDGALPGVLSTCHSSDFRPTLQAVSVACRGERVYDAGPWDEEAAWLFGPQSLDLPLRRPVRMSVSFSQTGFHVLRSRSDEATFATFRCGSIRDRFSQIDMLHVDVFWKGQNVLVDGGSYLYNGPPAWHDYFMETGSHNTVVVDGRDQMVHFRKFKCLYWTQSQLLGLGDEAGWTVAVGEHYGFRRYPGGCVHRRAVAFHLSGLGVVRDTVTGSGVHKARLHWLGGPFPHQFDVAAARLLLETPAGEFSVQALRGDGNPTRADVVVGGEAPPRGWQSRYYAEKIPVPSLAAEVEEGCPVEFVTVFGSGRPVVQVDTNRLYLQSVGETFLLEMTPDGGLRPASAR
jgi:hypothetical protein